MRQANQRFRKHALGDGRSRDRDREKPPAGRIESEIRVCFRLPLRGSIRTKRYKFLVPIELAAASLIGGNVNAQPTQEVPVTESQSPDQQNLPERAVLMKFTDQGAIHLQRESHVSKGGL
jgi:hypothetical protein